MDLSSCTADTRVLIEGTAGFWYKLYNGSERPAPVGTAVLLRDPQRVVGSGIAE